MDEYLVSTPHGDYGPFDSLSKARDCARELPEWTIIDRNRYVIDFQMAPNPDHRKCKIEQQA